MPFGIDGLDNFGLCCLEAALVCNSFNDEVFVFCNLLQMVNFIGTDCSHEWAGVFEDIERFGISGECMFTGLTRIVKVCPWLLPQLVVGTAEKTAPSSCVSLVMY